MYLAPPSISARASHLKNRWNIQLFLKFVFIWTKNFSVYSLLNKSTFFTPIERHTLKNKNAMHKNPELNYLRLLLQLINLCFQFCKKLKHTFFFLFTALMTKVYFLPIFLHCFLFKISTLQNIPDLNFLITLYLIFSFCTCMP